MNDLNHRRAEGVAEYISSKFGSSDVILLQEWWFDERFDGVFDSIVGDDFERVAERRPGDERDGGMCCLVRRGGKLELVKSDRVLTGPQRIAQIVHCRERCPTKEGGGRDVFIANSHLSFPGHEDPAVNSERQAREAEIILDALSKASSEWVETMGNSRSECLQVVILVLRLHTCMLKSSLLTAHITVSFKAHQTSEMRMQTAMTWFQV